MSDNIKYRDRIIELYNEGLSYRDIADTLNKELNLTSFYYESVRGICRTYRKQIARKNANSMIENAQSKEKKVIELGVVPSEITCNVKNKILILNDLHIPYQIDEVYDIVRKHKDEINAIIFGGDILDMKCVSSFPDIEKTTIEEELAKGIEVLQRIRDIVGSKVKMICIYGNHEMRIQRYIAMLHQRELAQFLNPNVLEHLRDGFVLYKGTKPITYQGVKDLIIINSWYVVVNNELIVCHPDNYSKVVCKNSDKAIEYFIDKGEQFEAVVAAHNHHNGYHPDHFNKLSIESGCLCQPMKYTDRRTNTIEQDNGYVVVTFNQDGTINRNETRLYTLPRKSLPQDNHIGL